MEQQNQLTITDNPQLLIRKSTDVAGACKEIVTKTAIKIQGKKYVPIEGWMTIATAHGCSLSASDVKAIDGGISAIGEVRRLSDGIVLGRAEGFVGDDEKTWASRALYARRAMAQTRAMSRAARSVFAHVVVMMDAGLSTTPAEEMGHEPNEEKDVSPNFSPAEKPKISYEEKYMQAMDDYFISSTDHAYEATVKLFAYINEGKKIDLEKLKNYIDLKLEHIKENKFLYGGKGFWHLKKIAELFGLSQMEYFSNQYDLERHSRG